MAEVKNNVIRPYRTRVTCVLVMVNVIQMWAVNILLEYFVNLLEVSSEVPSV